jgi:bifunctional phosphoglucose/phosphomannose isomerase
MNNLQQELSPIYGFKEQFSFIPEINNSHEKFKKFIVCGMGGSAITVTLLQLLFPDLTLELHNSYGLPKKYSKEETLFIFNSYSGNTEEILDGLERAVKENLHTAILSRGGAIIERAEKESLCFARLPESSLEPRFSIGHQMIGLLALMGENEKITALRSRIELLSLEKLEEDGERLAEMFNGKYPVLYASENFFPVAYLIKAAINEGAKIPTFVSKIPESNHNELQSFVTSEENNESKNFAFLYFISKYDHTRILKRISTMNNLAAENGFTSEVVHGDHTDTLSIFETVITGYFMATFLALKKDINPYTTPLIAEFKKRMLL